MDQVPNYSHALKTRIYFLLWAILILSGIVAKRIYFHPDMVIFFHLPAAVFFVLGFKQLSRNLKSQYKKDLERLSGRPFGQPAQRLGISAHLIYWSCFRSAQNSLIWALASPQLRKHLEGFPVPTINQVSRYDQTRHRLEFLIQYVYSTNFLHYPFFSSQRWVTFPYTAF